MTCLFCFPLPCFFFTLRLVAILFTSLHAQVSFFDINWTDLIFNARQILLATSAACVIATMDLYHLVTYNTSRSIDLCFNPNSELITRVIRNWENGF